MINIFFDKIKSSFYRITFKKENLRKYVAEERIARRMLWMRFSGKF